MIDRSEYDVRVIREDKNFNNIRKKIEIKSTDMNEDLVSKCVEKISTAVEKFMTTDGVDPQPDVASKFIKDQMETENGPIWICIIGESFAFNVKSQTEAFLYCYIGDYGILLYKC